MARRDKTLKHVGAYLSPAKHEAVESLGKRLKLSLQKTVELAIDGLLVSDGIAVPQPGMPSAEESLWIRKLLDLLRSRDVKLIGVVKHALDLHARDERANRKIG